ncbi:hypothetical protein MC885_012794 [Smutsia gigantea]|nr:hypothetical protein MC885_012794 [Smutsia gigantea]
MVGVPGAAAFQRYDALPDANVLKQLFSSEQKLGPRWKSWKCVNCSLKGNEKTLSRRKRQTQQLISSLIRQDDHQFHKENVLDGVIWSREKGASNAWIACGISNGINHSPPTLNGAPSPPQRFSNGPASSTSSALTNQQLPATCGARQLSKLKRFLTTLQQFGNDISPEIGEKVRTLVLALVLPMNIAPSSSFCIDRFLQSRSKLATSDPLPSSPCTNLFSPPSSQGHKPTSTQPLLNNQPTCSTVRV